MAINLKTLSFGNLYSYGDNNTIILNKSPITQLTAINGSGKTSLALIIQELLYSKNIKSIKKGDLLNRYISTESWWGEVEFSDSTTNTDYKIRVDRKGVTSKVKFYENGIDISDHKVLDTYKKVKAVLKMDFEIFSQLTYQSSTDLLDFIKATDTNRKKFLINLFGLAKYTNIGEILKIELSDAEKEVTLLTGELNAVQRFLSEVSIKQKRKQKAVPEIEEKLLQTEKDLQKELSSFEVQCKTIDKNNLLIKEQSELTFDMDIQKPEAIDSAYKEVKAANDMIISANSFIKNLNSNINSIDTADVCYACNRPIDNTKSINMIKALKEKRSENEEYIIIYERIKLKYETQIKAYESSLALYEANKKAIERFEQLAQLIDSNLPITYPDFNKIASDLEDITVEIMSQREEREEAIVYNEQVKAHNTQIDTLTNQKREFLARQELLNNDILKVKDRVKNLNILRKAFSTSGIVAFKLENLTKELEDTINSYLAELSDGQFQVVFRLTGEKLNVIVRDHGVETPIETVSGGEFSRIQASILLAIRNILSKIGGNTINLLFLDEIMGVLDYEGREKLVEVLQTEIGLNVFLISHEYTHPLIDKVEIIKENNISRIEYN